MLRSSSRSPAVIPITGITIGAIAETRAGNYAK